MTPLARLALRNKSSMLSSIPEEIVTQDVSILAKVLHERSFAKSLKLEAEVGPGVKPDNHGSSAAYLESDIDKSKISITQQPMSATLDIGGNSVTNNDYILDREYWASDDVVFVSKKKWASLFNQNSKSGNKTSPPQKKKV